MGFGWTLEIVRRPDGAKGWMILPKRWVVERTFGWLGRYRRLSRDFEHTVESSEVMVYIAGIRRMLKLLANWFSRRSLTAFVSLFVLIACTSAPKPTERQA